MMKKLAASVLILTVFAAALAAEETGLSGVIAKNEVWTPKKSPYVISDTVIIEKTGFVTIQPGTTLKFKKDGKLIVRGALYAKGDPQNPVRFLPYDGESFYEGIRFEGRYKSTIEFSIMIRGAIVTEGAPVNIINNYILNATGVEVFHFASAFIKDNYFYNNTYGVYIEGQQVGYRIEANTFNRNRFAIYVKKAEKSAGLVTANSFFENTVNYTNYSAQDLEAKGNFWGVTDEQKVAALIYDKKNNNKVGTVEYKPYLTAPKKLFEPTPAFISLVKQYLSLKRADEEIRRVSFGTGLMGFMPFSPESVKKEADMGMGMSAEFTATISGPYFFGIEGKMFGFENKDKTDYDFKLSVTSLLANLYGYLGYSPRVFFLPFAKIGNGVSMLSGSYKFKNGTSVKVNEVNYTAAAGLGVEWFMFSFFSIKAESSFNMMFRPDGNFMYQTANLTGNLYFTLPFFNND